MKLTLSNELLDSLVNVTILVAAISTLILWLKRWIRKQVAEPVQDTHREVTQNGGLTSKTPTLADYIRNLAEQQEANTLMLRTTIERLDKHLEGHP